LKPIQPGFKDLPLPDEVPQANRAFENWVARLLR
jgi:hypothetical protein